jgi:recombination protein RecT
MSTQAVAKTETPPKALTPIKRVEEMLLASRDRMQMVLPKHLTPERMIRVTMSALYRTPELQDCDPKSVVAAVVQASELGLEPCGALQHGYLIPYKNKNTNSREAQFMPGYRGLIELARRSGKLRSISARVVYEKDKFNLNYTAERVNFLHEPFLLGDAGKPVLIYATAVLEGDQIEFEAMPIHEIDAIRERSQAGQSGPWVTDYNEMAKKTVLRRLLKRLPMSTELAQAIEISDAIEVRAESVEAATAERAAQLRAQLDAAKTVEVISE